MAAVWVLNLDADLELGARGPYTATRTVQAAMRAQRDRLAETLLVAGETVVDEDTPPRSANGRPGYAFCPSPRAVALLERAGATPLPHPPASVLRAVNDRAFCTALGPGLPGSGFFTDLDAARAKLATGDGPWRVKRSFGMAGRGQRIVTPGPLAKVDDDFLRSAIAGGGVQIEPHVAISLEVAIHGWVTLDGSYVLGRIVQQRCDARGGWVATEPLEGPLAHAATLEAEAVRVARALHDAGYFGPFGVDAFAYEGGFQARSEINARFSMGFAVGLPGWRALADSLAG
jgi:hypothetical protein